MTGKSHTYQTSPESSNMELWTWWDKDVVKLKAKAIAVWFGLSAI
jgi:hypothetical protein